VVLGEPVDHAVRTVAQGYQPGRGKHADLAHAAADELSPAPRSVDEFLRSDDERANGAGEPLREAERHRVGRLGQLPRRQAESNRCVEEARTVDVEWHAVVVGDLGDGAGVAEAQRLPIE